MGTEEENKEVVRRYFELYNQHKFDAANELFAPSFFGENFTSEQNKELDTMTFKAFPDYKLTIVDMIAEGDKVATIRHITGTHTGEPYMGIPATGKKIDATGAAIVRIADNKMVEGNVTGPFLLILQQLGILPEVPEAIQAYKESHNLE